MSNMHAEQSLITSEIFNSKIKSDRGSKLFEERISIHLYLYIFTRPWDWTIVGSTTRFSVNSRTQLRATHTKLGCGMWSIRGALRSRTPRVVLLTILVFWSQR